MADLTFIQSYSINKFKTMVDAEKIEVLKNPKTDKLFFDAEGTTGGCAKALDLSGDIQISQVEGTDGKFYLMHNKGVGAEVVATF